ncbi:chorismate-binding protein [Sulfuricystis multivorans]|uniref:chorismate-binding protein n=1 Tax=Sulfuricystis multivorans TaxID=2211108 RepID=UPI000F836401|nr:chorismate-binding protein [Sulfuricystis multivorans]
MKARVDFPQGDARLRLVFAAPLARLVAQTLEEVPAVLDAALQAARAGRWVVGFVAFDAAPAFDAALRVRPPDGFLPLAAFAVHAAAEEGAEPAADEHFHCGPWHIATDEAAACAAIDTLRRRIDDGEFYQVNLTTRVFADFSGSGAALFAALVATQPAGYCLHLRDDDWEILSVSPELFFDWHPDGTLITRPMKGTAPRHDDPDRDAAAAKALLTSEKERAENLMIVDLMRNDLSRIARLGTVCVPELFALDGLPTAWQMSSTVQCITRPEVALSDVFAALFPCGSVTGAPKVAAMAAIAALEDAPRGAYCGALGIIRPGGHATFNVGIRTVVIDRRLGRAECGIGSGIVHDSEPRREYAEWLIKRRFLLRATANFALLETLALEDGDYVLLERHLERLSSSAAHFGFPCDRARIGRQLAALAAAHPAGSWRVRLLLGRTGSVETEIHALEPTPPEVIVVLASRPIEADVEFLRHKTTERCAYAPFSPPPGVFDTLLWNAQGEITEFTRGNVVLELDGSRVTPPLAAGLLPGVLRAKLLARGEIVERRVRIEELARATQLWFINSVRGWVRVKLLDP